MDIKEFRIGNLIENYHAPLDITEIDLDVMNRNSDGIIEGDPIVLNRIWLDRLGFKLENKLWRKQISNNYELCFNSDLDCGICFEWRDELMSIFWNDIRKVHQLQNLYYSLTGEELTLNN